VKKKRPIIVENQFKERPRNQPKGNLPPNGVGRQQQRVLVVGVPQVAVWWVQVGDKMVVAGCVRWG